MNMTAMDMDRATTVITPTVTSSVRERKKAMLMIVPDEGITGHISPAGRAGHESDRHRHTCARV